MSALPHKADQIVGRRLGLLLTRSGRLLDYVAWQVSTENRVRRASGRATLIYSVATGVFTIIGVSEVGFSAARFIVMASPPRRAATTSALKVGMVDLLSLGNPFMFAPDDE